MRTIPFLILLLAAMPSHAQSKFFSTSSRGGAEGAKQNAQISTLQTENQRMNACTSAGRIYAPTHPNGDANDCIPHMLLNPTNGQATFTSRVNVNSGGVTVTGPSTFNSAVTIGAGGATIAGGGLNVTGNATLNNNLAVTGLSTFGNNITVNGRVTSSQLYVGSGNVGSIPSCTSAQKLHWNGAAWACATDNIGATSATESDPKVGTLINGRWCHTDGAKVVCDRPAPFVCGTAQKLRWTGTTWECIADNGLVTEVDPKVGALTASKWCRGNGSQVVCDQDTPLSTENDPSVGSLTNGKVCKASSGKIVCTYDEGDPTVGGLTNGKWCKASSGQVVCTFDDPAEADPKVGTLTDNRWCTASSGKVVCNSILPAETDPKVGALTETRWCVASSGKVVCNSLLPAEVDPKVGALTNSKWCRSDGAKVICDQNAPLGAEADPKVGTLTDGKWCSASGGKVVCNQNAPAAGGGTVVQVANACAGPGNNGLASCTATCTAGVVVGGGCMVQNGAANMQNSFPSSATAWTCYANAYAGIGGAQTLSAYALCLQ